VSGLPRLPQDGDDAGTDGGGRAGIARPGDRGTGRSGAGTRIRPARGCWRCPRRASAAASHRDPRRLAPLSMPPAEFFRGLLAALAGC
jgi:hypothetical protein